jgi:hypothetical protein
MVQKVIMGVLVLGVIVLALPMIAAVMKGDASAAKATAPAPETPTPAAEPAPAPAAQPVPMPQAQMPMPGGAPQVVSMVPANGSMGVSSRLDKLIVTFDRPMAGGFSWTGGGPQMPDARTGCPTARPACFPCGSAPTTATAWD